MSITSVAHRPMNLVTEAPEAGAKKAGAVTVNPSPQQHSPAVATPAVKTVRQLLADQQDMLSLADKLRNLTTWVAHKLSDQLNRDVLVPFINSSETLTHTTPPTLAAVIKDLGYELPQTLDEAKKLADVLEKRASVPPLRDFGGGLSWPIPISQADQRRIERFLYSSRTGVSGLPLPRFWASGVLGYLLMGGPVTRGDLKDPVTALQTLLDSPKAVELGQALQAHLGGVASDTSIYDYILTTINLSLDPESSLNNVRNKVAGFDLLDSSHWGLAPSEVVKKLGLHLVSKGRATQESAELASLLLLAPSAPQFLVKDIPGGVTVGSAMWTQLTIAAARIEAQTPGRVQNMTYAEVIAQAEPIATDTYANQVAQRDALSDWAQANGVLKPSETEHSAAEMQQAKTAYNDRLNALVKSSSLLETPVPSRKDIALEYLKAAFPQVDPAVFEIKDLQIGKEGGGRIYAAHLTRRSMLDVVMEGAKLDRFQLWVKKDPRIPIASFNAYVKTKKHLEVNKLFGAHYETTMKSLGDGHHELVKQLIAKLPLADRMNLEYGDVKFFHTNEYKIAKDFTSPLELTERGRRMHIKTTLNGKVTIYEVNTSAGVIEKQDHLAEKFSEPYSPEKMDVRRANLITRRSLLDPYNGARDNEAKEQPVSAQTPDSYRSKRTDFIADMYVKALALDGEDLLNHARGITSFDRGRALGSVIDEFFLNLIPLRSAINNFRQGNTFEGVSDLAMDAFGLLTLGAGKAAQAVKVFGKGMSGLKAAGKATQAVKFLGAAALEFLNPIGGVGDMLVVGANLVRKGFAKGADLVTALRGASGNYDLLKAASKHYDAAAAGAFKVDGQTVQGTAILQGRQWYAYDPASGASYGSPRMDFNPAAVALDGEIRAFGDGWLWMFGSTSPAHNSTFRRDYSAAIVAAKAEDNAAYIRGQNTAHPQDIDGYTPALKIDDLKRLAVARRRTPMQLGSLVRRIDDLEMLPAKFKAKRDIAELTDAVGFKRGYDAGKPQAIPGFADTLNNNELAELTLVPGRTPEEIGRLVRYMENRRSLVSLENSRVFSDEVKAAGGTFIPVPQGLVLGQIALMSEGECAAISNIIAAATRYNKRDTFIKNLYASMVPPLSADEIARLRVTDPAKAAREQRRAVNTVKFRQQLEDYQGILGSQFHLGMESRQVTHTAIISELASAQTSKTLLINGPDHGITAGVVVSGQHKEWFYFDPNFGLALFADEAAMRKGLDSFLNSGRTKSLLNHFGPSTSAPQYKISAFEPGHLNAAVKSVPGKVDDLFINEL